MNLTIGFSTKDKKFSCTKHGGGNISPLIKWTQCPKSVSYALIMEDPDAVGGLFMHWYIPYISNKLNGIEELVQSTIINSSRIRENVIREMKKSKIVQGYNGLDQIGYHGMCPPVGSGTHHYTFIFYCLDGKVDFHKNNILSIKSSTDFENKLEAMNIGILHKKKKVFKYES